MMYIKVYILVTLFFSSVLMANVTALNGGLDRKNTLVFKSANSYLELKVENSSISLATTDENLIIDESFLLQNKKVNAGRELFTKYLQQTKKTRLKSTSYEYSSNLQNLSIREIKSELSKHLEMKLKQKPNYLSHTITNISVPEDTMDNIDISYKIIYKSNNKKIRVVTYSQLLSALIKIPKPLINIKKSFILKYKNRYFISEIVLQKDKQEHPITNKDIKTKTYAVKIIEELNVYKKHLYTIFSDIKDKSILEVVMSNKLPISLSIIDKDASLIEFNLYNISNPITAKYMEEEQKRPILLNNFDFSKEPIWANFKVKTADGVKYLKTDYKMVGKRKNIIQVSLDGSSSILNPQSKSTKKLTHSAYIVDIKTFLFEMKKISKLNNKTNLKWTQKVKQSMLSLMYKDSNGEMVKKKISRGRKQFYDISGLWYLISWSATNNISEKSFLFMKQDFPFEAKYSKTTYGYLVTQRGQEKFKFYLDKYNRIIRVIDVDNDIDMVISKNGYINSSINKNITYLDNYLIKHNLKKVD